MNTNTAPNAVPTAFYLRYSNTDGTDNIGGQRELCRNWMLANGHNPDDVREFAEDRQSAYKKPMAQRPRWQELQREIELGRIQRVVTRQIDRLTRRTRDMLDLIDLTRKTGVQIIAVWNGGALDLSTPQGIQFAEMAASQAQAESAIKAERIRAAKARTRAAGQAVGGSRPFGYTSRNGDIVPEEAQLISDAMGLIIKGESLSKVTAFFNASGMKPPRASKWSNQTVKPLLCRWRNAGRLAHNPDWTDRTNGVPWTQQVDAGPSTTFSAIVDLATLETVRSILLNPERAANARKGGPDPTTLLGGLITCAKCNVPCFGASGTAGYPSGDPRAKSYKCPTCKQSVRRDYLDDMARAAMLRLWMRTSVEELAPTDEIKAAIANVQKRRTDLVAERKEISSLVGDGLLSATDARNTLERLKGREEALEADMSDLQRRYVLAESLLAPIVEGRSVNMAQAASVAQHFETLPLAIQRKQIQHVWDITLRPAHEVKAQTFTIGGKTVKESVSRDRVSARRAKFDCRIMPALSFDPFTEDMLAAAEALQDGDRG